MINLKRTELYKAIPLETPYTLQISPSFYCNFKCGYCLQSLPDNKLRKMGFKKQMMEMQIYKKAIDDMVEFDGKLKALIFSGFGEPLLNPHIAEMVKYAKEADIADRIDLLTNAALLTHELSDALIDAGLDRLRVSLQGITSKKYKETSDVDIDVNEIKDNIKYFYDHKTTTDVYVKTMDITLESDEDQSKFKNMFADSCDESAIEYLIPLINEIDYSSVGKVSGINRMGNKGSSRICSQPFYMMYLFPDGSVTPCCQYPIPYILGNVKEYSLKQIWDSEARQKFLLKQLNDRSQNYVCRDCTLPENNLQQGDFLDGHEKELIKKIRTR